MIPSGVFDSCVSQVIGASGTSNSSSSIFLTNNDNVIGSNEHIERFIYCFSNELEKKQASNNENFKLGLLLFAGSLVFFMQAGFAMLCAGAVRKKNVQNTMLKNLLDGCSAAIAFYVIGFALAYGGDFDTDFMEDTTTTTEFTTITSTSTFAGNNNYFSIGLSTSGFAFWFFQYTFSAASVTIVAGTLAERCQMTGYILYSFFLSGFVYPIVAHAVWSPHGFLSATNSHPLYGIGMIDFAGSGVVHLTGGCTALFATYILGSRRGRFYHTKTGEMLETPKDMKGHSITLQVLGAMILWFGWYGFNGGSALLLPEASTSPNTGKIGAFAVVNTTLAAASGGISALLVNFLIVKKKTNDHMFDIEKTVNGVLAGLVSITAGCAVVDHYAAVIIGCIGGGLVYIYASQKLLDFKIDDAVDAVPVHLFNGIWGLIAVGLFASPQHIRDVFYPTSTSSPGGGLLYTGNGRLFACQIIGVIFIIAWTFLLMVPFFLLLNYLGWFRTEVLSELVGLDTVYHHDDTALITSSNMNENKKSATATKVWEENYNSDTNYVDDNRDHNHMNEDGENNRVRFMTNETSTVDSTSSRNQNYRNGPNNTVPDNIESVQSSTVPDNIESVQSSTPVPTVGTATTASIDTATKDTYDEDDETDDDKTQDDGVKNKHIAIRKKYNRTDAEESINTLTSHVSDNKEDPIEAYTRYKARMIERRLQTLDEKAKKEIFGSKESSK